MTELLISNQVTPSTEYFGGVFDHSLQIEIYPSIEKPRKGRQETLLYKPNIEVGHTVRQELTAVIQREFGGTDRTSEVGKNHRIREAKNWLIRDSLDGIVFLQKALPLLSIKKTRALIMIDFLSRRLERIHQRISPEDRLAEDEEFYNRFTETKKLEEVGDITVPTPQRLAGMLDAGGTIGISKKAGKHPEYVLYVCYTSPNPYLTGLFDKRYKIQTSKPGAERSDGYTTQNWVVYSDQAQEVLADLVPYFTYNKLFAEQGIAFQSVQRRLADQYLHNRVQAETEAKLAGFSSAALLREQIREGFRERMLKIRFSSTPVLV